MEDRRKEEKRRSKTFNSGNKSAEKSARIQHQKSETGGEAISAMYHLFLENLKVDRGEGGAFESACMSCGPMKRN